MPRWSPYGYESGKGSKDYGKNSSDSGGKGRKDYGKGSMSSIMIESMVERIDHLEKTCEKPNAEIDRLTSENDCLQTENDIMKLEHDRLKTENCRLQSDTDKLWLHATDRLQTEVDRLQIELDCMVATNKRLRHGISKHAEQASKFEDSLNELAYPFATIR